jgi:outer membrane protein
MNGKLRLLLCFILMVSGFSANHLSAQRVISMQEALDVAIENSPQIRTAKLNLERSRELLNAQKAALKSRFSLTLEPFHYTHDRQFNDLFSTWNTSETKQSSGVFSIAQPLLLTDGTIALRNQFAWRNSYSEFQDTKSETYNNNLYLTYDQPLFTYNRTRLALADVQLDLENASLNYNLQELVLEQRVAQAFYQSFQNKMSVQVTKEEVQNTEASYNIIKNKVDAGLAAQEELYQAELNLATARSSLQNEQVSLENALDQFKQMIGLSLFEDITVAAEVQQDSIPIDLDKALDYGLKYRLELKQRALDIESARANLVRSSATNEFEGNLSLSYGIFGNDEKVNDIYQAPTQNQDFSISFEIPIFDWGEKKSRIKAAEASVKNSQLSEEDEKNNIIIGIRQAYRNVQNQKLQIDIAQQNVKVAQLTYDINLERYENGDLTSMDLNLYQNQLSQKKIGLVDAMIAYKLALLDLKVESMWDFIKNRPVLE